jgi:hypothetical protein
MGYVPAAVPAGAVNERTFAFGAPLVVNEENATDANVDDAPDTVQVSVP